MSDDLVYFDNGYRTGAEIMRDNGWDKRKAFTYLDGVAQRHPDKLEYLSDDGWVPFAEDTGNEYVVSAIPSEAFLATSGGENFVRVKLVNEDIP